MVRGVTEVVALMEVVVKVMAAAVEAADTEVVVEDTKASIKQLLNYCICLNY